MKKLLRRNEKEAIRNKFGILPIFQLLLPAGKKIERELNVFHLSGEQIIIEIICLLDNIREYSEADAKAFLRDIDDTIYDDCRDLSPENTPDNELVLSTVTILKGLEILLAHCNDVRHVAYYKQLQTLLSFCCSKPQHSEAAIYVQSLFFNTLYRMDEEKLCLYVTQYMESEIFLSDEIDNFLQVLNLDRDDYDVVDVQEPDKITYRQLVLLFQQLLDVSLNPSYIVQSELAALIAYISGREKESIRRMIVQLNKELESGNPDKQQSIKDMEDLANRISPFNERIASGLRNFFEKG